MGSTNRLNQAISRTGMIVSDVKRQQSDAILHRLEGVRVLHQTAGGLVGIRCKGGRR